MIWRKETPQAQENEQPRGFDDFELRLGDILRGERATLGKSLLDVQRELHIRAAHIAAIENGDLAAFEAPSFVAGFVRSYARYLGMDPEWVYERFCLEHDFHVGHGMAPGTPSAISRVAPQQRSQGDFSASAPLRGVGMVPPAEPFWHRIEPGALGSISVLIALIAGLGMAGWTVLKEVQQVQVAPADVIPSVVSDFNPLAGGSAQLGGQAAGIDTDPLTAAPGTGAALALADSANDPVRAGTAEGVVRLARPEALDIPVLVPRDGPIAAITPDTRPAVPQTISADAAVAAALAPQAPATEAPQVTAHGPATVELLAVRPAWLRVRAADGSVIFERILDAGETYAIPRTEEPPTLHAGNSGSVYFLIDGQPYGPAAPGGNVVRNVALDVDSLRQAYAAADLGADQELGVHVARLRER